jgi:diguanylate cyclase (GGDEF)-like protein/PAS domain S-box-containing protein
LTQIKGGKAAARKNGRMSQQAIPPVNPSPAFAALDVVARMVAALDLTPTVAVCSIDREGVVRFCNAACAELSGLPAELIVGRKLRDVLSRMGRQEEHDRMLEEVWRSGRNGPAGDWRVQTADGRERWLYSVKIPIRHDGELGQIVCMDVDITERKQEADALAAAGSNFAQMFQRSSDAIVLLRDGIVEEANPAALALFRCASAERLKGHGLDDFSPVLQPSGSASGRMADELVREAGEQGNRRFEWHYVDCEGHAFWAEVLMTAISLDRGQWFYVMVRDISERKQAEHTLHLAAQVFENSHDAIVLADRARRVIAINRSYSSVTGFSAEDMLGKPLSAYRSGLEDEGFYREVWNRIDATEHWQGETWSRRKDGALFPAWVSITAIRDSAGRVCNYMGILSDITERKKSEEHTRHLAEHDFLTDLPNRVLLVDRLGHALAAARRSGEQMAILFLDLDRFKPINDTLGHASGDRVLQEVAARLVKCVREADTVARQGGDEFVIILADIGSAARAVHVAELVLKAIEQDFMVGDQVLHISTSIGIAMYPADGADIDTLLKHADIAMYHAKQNGRNNCQFFSGEMNARVVERSELESGLRCALTGQQFELAFQPELDVATGEMVGMEALLRWRHPKLGLLLPRHFIDVAHEAGLMIAIGNWVLQMACKQARGWHDEGRRLVVSVNLSSTQFLHKDLLRSVSDALAASGLEARWLELELTEAILMPGGARVSDTLQALHELGVRLAIDDFGTGWSRLGQLKDYPINQLKIAQAFMGGGNADTTAIRTIIAMARSMDMTVIAEGVETPEQLELLRSLGCDLYQGELASAAAGAPPPVRGPTPRDVPGAGDR